MTEQNQSSEILVIPRIMIAAPSSGQGKTTVMAGMVVALREQGLRVATFKAGPDYLDPTYHGEASGQTCLNLDQWLMGRDGVRRTFARAARGCDIALIEGVMGLYDGLGPTSDEGSSWELARTLDCPIVLVVDARGMARSVAALVKGFKEFSLSDETVPADQNRLAGVVANRIGSQSHGQLLGRALASVPGVCYLGGVQGGKQNIFSERHLGLVSLRNHPRKHAELVLASQRVKEGLDLQALVMLAQRAPVFGTKALPPRISAASLRPPSSPQFEGARDHHEPRPSAGPLCRLGVAKDAAFDFYYEENLELLRAAGAELVFFSPIKDPHLPRDPSGAWAVEGLYFGGGYPELHAQELTDNRTMMEDIRAFGRAGGIIYGECGGFMYLCETLQTSRPSAEAASREVLPDPQEVSLPRAGGSQKPLAAPSATWEMVGLLPGHIVMHEKLTAIGYVEVETQSPSPLGPAGLRFRGHQFRYSERLLPESVEDASLGVRHAPYRIRRRRDQKALEEGALVGRVLGSYVHAHWGSNPLVAQSFVAQCQALRQQGGPVPGEAIPLRSQGVDP